MQCSHSESAVWWKQGEASDPGTCGILSVDRSWPRQFPLLADRLLQLGAMTALKPYRAENFKKIALVKWV
mgnify:FL=1